MTTISETSKNDIKKALRTLRNNHNVQAYILGIKSEFADDFSKFNDKLKAKDLDITTACYVYATKFNENYIYFNHDNGGAEIFVKVLDEMAIPFEWDGSEHRCVCIQFNKEAL